jgi:hypothetical protein
MDVYGFVALTNSSNLSNSSKGSLFNTLNEVNVPARVLDIVLHEDHYLFEKLGIGGIEYELVTSPGTKGTAIYYNSSIKHYPLINEIVSINSYPNNKLGMSNTNATKYYSSPISLWQHPHHNGYPTEGNQVNNTQNKSLDQIQVGSSKINTDQTLTINLGNTFKERGDIHPLLPFEGDVIHEGRWGNSIRFGSTVGGLPSPTITNNWSETGTNGDPITIIRNGQGEQTKEGWLSITEDINKDDSSIYLTSTQQVPLEAASTSYLSYNSSISPDSPNAFSGQQILLNSGRLVFNAGTDHMLLSSAKSINLNSLDSVNVDTPKVIIQSKNIYLGSYSASEPLLLGNATVNLLGTLIQTLKQFSEVLKTQSITTPTIPGQPANIPGFVAYGPILSTMMDSLDQQLNDITSKYNFTV